MAHDGGVAIECIGSARTQDNVAFNLDFDRGVATAEFPINWTWFADRAIVFGYSALINGHYRTLQSYTLDRATGTLEICDFASGEGEACGRRQCSAAPTHTLARSE